MNNPETLETFGTQGTGQTKETKNKTQLDTESWKDEEPHHKPEVNQGTCEGYSVSASYKTPAMMLLK